MSFEGGLAYSLTFWTFILMGYYICSGRRGVILNAFCNRSARAGNLLLDEVITVLPSRLDHISTLLAAFSYAEDGGIHSLHPYFLFPI